MAWSTVLRWRSEPEVDPDVRSTPRWWPPAEPQPEPDQRGPSRVVGAARPAHTNHDMLIAAAQALARRAADHLAHHIIPSVFLGSSTGSWRCQHAVSIANRTAQR